LLEVLDLAVAVANEHRGGGRELVIQLHVELVVDVLPPR
jgi:hypothetical protein